MLGLGRYSHHVCMRTCWCSQLTVYRHVQTIRPAVVDAASPRTDCKDAAQVGTTAVVRTQDSDCGHVDKTLERETSGIQMG